METSDWVVAGIALASLAVLIWQNQIAKSAAKTQSTVTVWNFLLAEEFRTAREHVIQKLEKKKFAKWNEKDERYADKVCSSYSSAASLIKRKYLEREMFLDDWGSSIKRTHQILEPHLKKRRKKMGDRYWDDFDWIYERVLKWEKKFKRN